MMMILRPAGSDVLTPPELLRDPLWMWRIRTELLIAIALCLAWRNECRSLRAFGVNEERKGGNGGGIASSVGERDKRALTSSGPAASTAGYEVRAGFVPPWLGVQAVLLFAQCLSSSRLSQTAIACLSPSSRATHLCLQRASYISAYPAFS